MNFRKSTTGARSRIGRRGPSRPIEYTDRRGRARERPRGDSINPRGARERAITDESARRSEGHSVVVRSQEGRIGPSLPVGARLGAPIGE